MASVRQAVSRIVCTPEDDFVSVSGDCDDTDPSAYPGAEEVCDGVDNDCSGEADEGLLMTVYPDPDGDGYGMALLPMEACVVESGMSATAGDCDETDAAVHPGAEEVCDGLDNDCSGEVDEGLGITYYLDTDGDGFGVADMTIEACSFPVGYALTHTATAITATTASTRPHPRPVTRSTTTAMVTSMMTMARLSSMRTASGSRMRMTTALVMPMTACSRARRWMGTSPTIATVMTMTPPPSRALKRSGTTASIRTARRKRL